MVPLTDQRLVDARGRELHQSSRRFIHRPSKKVASRCSCIAVRVVWSRGALYDRRQDDREARDRRLKAER